MSCGRTDVEDSIALLDVRRLVISSLSRLYASHSFLLWPPTDVDGEAATLLKEAEVAAEDAFEGLRRARKEWQVASYASARYSAVARCAQHNYDSPSASPRMSKGQSHARSCSPTLHETPTASQRPSAYSTTPPPAASMLGRPPKELAGWEVALEELKQKIRSVGPARRTARRRSESSRHEQVDTSGSTRPQRTHRDNGFCASEPHQNTRLRQRSVSQSPSSRSSSDSNVQVQRSRRVVLPEWDEGDGIRDRRRKHRHGRRSGQGAMLSDMREDSNGRTFLHADNDSAESSDCSRKGRARTHRRHREQRGLDATSPINDVHYKRRGPTNILDSSAATARDAWKRDTELKVDRRIAPNGRSEAASGREARQHKLRHLFEVLDQI